MDQWPAAAFLGYCQWPATPGNLTRSRYRDRAPHRLRIYSETTQGKRTMGFEFWVRTSGTWVNVATVLGGTTLGLLLRGRLPGAMVGIITQGVGFVDTGGGGVGWGVGAN